MKVLSQPFLKPETLRDFLVGDERIVRGLLSRQYNEGNKDSPLLLSVKRNRKDLVRVLIEKGANHKHRDAKKRVALEYAYLNGGDPEMLALLFPYVHEGITVPPVGFYRPVPPAAAPAGLPVLDIVARPVAYGARR
jgi:ankyrin repeat protein